MLKNFFGQNKSGLENNSEQIALIDRIDKKHIPKHIAIIMDGNGRWAKKQNKLRAFGHYAGANILNEIVRACDDIGVEALTIYAFSTENWKRPADEVNILMELIFNRLMQELDELNKKNVRMIFSGDRSELPRKLVEAMEISTEKTKNNTGLVLNSAINYGGRAEILRAAKLFVQEVVENRVSIDSVDENNFEQYFYTAGLPDVDLLIRPGGDFRVSNFLLWQIAYAEIWVTDIFWPDFRKEDLFRAVCDFQKRDRRYGGLNINK